MKKAAVLKQYMLYVRLTVKTVDDELKKYVNKYSANVKTIVKANVKTIHVV